MRTIQVCGQRIEQIQLIAVGQREAEQRTVDRLTALRLPIVLGGVRHQQIVEHVDAVLVGQLVTYVCADPVRETDGDGLCVPVCDDVATELIARITEQRQHRLLRLGKLDPLLRLEGATEVGAHPALRGRDPYIARVR